VPPSDNAFRTSAAAVHESAIKICGTSLRGGERNAGRKKIAHFEVGYFLLLDSGGEDGNRTRLNGFAGR